MIDETLRQFVRRRAGDRCEYCRLPQHAVDGRFHVEHIAFRGPEIHGLTPTGRATVRLLQMNARYRVELRASLMAARNF
jgi:hypothetical protein